jgi:hypothetical protein
MLFSKQTKLSATDNRDKPTSTAEERTSVHDSDREKMILLCVCERLVQRKENRFRFLPSLYFQTFFFLFHSWESQMRMTKKKNRPLFEPF